MFLPYAYVSDVDILNSGEKMRRKFVNITMNDANLVEKINDNLTRGVDFNHIIKFCVDNAINCFNKSFFESYF